LLRHPDGGVQLTKANTFTGVPDGGWYIGLVEVEELTPKQLIVQDVLTAWTDFPPFSTV
jgi:hypothetical protein